MTTSRLNGTAARDLAKASADNKIADEDLCSELDLERQEPTSQIERLYQRIKAEAKSENNYKIKSMVSFMDKLKKMTFMDFHKDKKTIFPRVNTHDIRDNKQLSEMFQPFYNFNKEKGSMKSFLFHNRYEFKDLPLHLKRFQVYDPDYCVDMMLEYRRTVLNRRPRKSPPVATRRWLGYQEEVDDLLPALTQFEQKHHERLAKSAQMEPPSKPEKSSEFKIRRKIPSFRISKGDSSNKIKLSTSPKVEPPKEPDVRARAEDNLALELLRSEFAKSVTFRQQTLTEDFLESVQRHVDEENSHSLVPLMEIKGRRYFELFQMKDPGSLVLYRINDEGLVEDCQRLSSLEEFALPRALKHRPFFLFLFYHAFLLFENNWSFIYNLLLKNPIFENMKIDFSNIISGVNLTKFLLGEHFYETTKRPFSSALTKQLFKILRASARLTSEHRRRFPKFGIGVRELDHFDSFDSFYADARKADFDREAYLKEFCSFDDQLRKPRTGQAPTRDFPTPQVRHAGGLDLEEAPERTRNEFEQPKGNDRKFELFCRTVEKSNRVDYASYLKNSKKQLFCYKLRKFRNYRDKKLSKIKSLAKKFRHKHSKTNARPAERGQGRPQGQAV